VLVSFFLDFSLLNKVLDALSRSSRYRQLIEFIGNRTFVAGGISQFPRGEFCAIFWAAGGTEQIFVIVS